MSFCFSSVQLCHRWPKINLSRIFLNLIMFHLLLRCDNHCQMWIILDIGIRSARLAATLPPTSLGRLIWLGNDHLCCSLFNGYNKRRSRYEIKWKQKIRLVNSKWTMIDLLCPLVLHFQSNHSCHCGQESNSWR